MTETVTETGQQMTERETEREIENERKRDGKRGKLSVAARCVCQLINRLRTASELCRSNRVDNKRPVAPLAIVDRQPGGIDARRQDDSIPLQSKRSRCRSDAVLTPL